MGVKLLGIVSFLAFALVIQTTMGSPNGVPYRGPKLMDNTTLSGVNAFEDGAKACCNIPGCGHLCGCGCGSKCCANSSLCWWCC